MLPPYPAQHPACTTPAMWHPSAPRSGAVILFRRVLTLPCAMRGLALALSACHRCELLIDGESICRGPSRSDPRRWGVMRVELPRLAAGRHVLAVRVSHDGDGAGESQLGGPGFLVVAGLGRLGMLLASPGWRCCHDRSVQDCALDGWGSARRYAPLGAHEEFTAELHPWGWTSSGFDDRAWPEPLRLPPAADAWGNLALGVQLAPDPLPVLSSGGILPLLAVGDEDARTRRWAAGTGTLVVPPHARRRVVLSRGASGAHWPHLTWSGGRDADLRLRWCEAPQDGTVLASPRDRIAGRTLPGHLDRIRPDGGARRSWTPRWLRSGRMLVLEVRTRAAALRLAPVRLQEASFPFRTRLRLRADATWARLLQISDRTLRSCAYDTIWDCPHYEQCQFPGDSRVQAIAHYLLYNDDRLARKSLCDLADSQRPDGLLLCRAPARRPQRIDTFTLQWVLMLDEFRLWRGDVGFIASLLPAARRALDPFLGRLRSDGLVGAGLMAPFVDWSPGFTAGNAPEDEDGGSAIVSLLAAQACQALARLEAAAGWPELAPRWTRTSDALVRSVHRTCLAEGCLYDTPRRRSRSVHAQVEAIHAGLFTPATGRKALIRALDDDGVAQIGTRYYTWHLGRAWQAVGRSDLALALVEGWRTQMQAVAGLATWPESDGKPRSDCHGWGVYPVLAAASLLLGVRPVEPGMTAIALEPLADDGTGSIPTPHGLIRVQVSSVPGGRRLRWNSPVPVLVGGRRYRAGGGDLLLR
jgi:alpha-L-rhamnosidase